MPKKDPFLVTYFYIGHFNNRIFILTRKEGVGGSTQMQDIPARHTEKGIQSY